MKFFTFRMPGLRLGIRSLAMVRRTGCLGLLALAGLMHAPAMRAQTSIQLFSGPVDIRQSPASAGNGADAYNFSSNTLSLTCSASPISAVLSSTPDSKGAVLVDNDILVGVTAGGTTIVPANVCSGGVVESIGGAPFQDCFTSYYELAADRYIGTDPDTFLPPGGIAPIDISSFLQPGTQKLTVTLQDTGDVLTASTLYLNTNCTQNAVSGPAVQTGNPIPAADPTPAQATQQFSFNPVVNQQVGFTYDLSQALAAGDLTIQDGTIPQVTDEPLDPAIFQSQYAAGTSFATSNCLVHSGEALPNGNPACKLYTLQCVVGTGSEASGAQCPVSTEANEVFQDVFSGPPFTLPDIVTPNGTFHEGIGLLMADEGWTGGACTFDTAADLGSLDCPQNLLTSFTSSAPAGSMVKRVQGVHLESEPAAPDPALAGRPRSQTSSSSDTGSDTGTGRTTRPNSTFLSVAQVPEDLTTVSVAGLHPGNWIDSSSASVTFSSQPPNLTGSTLPGAASFVPSPIESITYGVSPAASVPAAGDPVAGDVTLTNPAGCPSPANPGTPAATVFTPASQPITGLADGYHLIHYFAQDCAGTQELHFTQDANGNWSTGFYTYAVNVDTVAPSVAAGPTLAPAANSIGVYTVGQTVTASFSCSDALSGVVLCGGQAFPPGTATTGALTAPVDTSSPGNKTFSVQAVDAAGNTATASVHYQVVAYDSQIQFTISPHTVTYPQSTTASITIQAPAAPMVSRKVKALSQSPGGTVEILDGLNVIGSYSLGGSGSTSVTLPSLSAGTHTLSAVYLGDANDPPGDSAPVTLTVNPIHINLNVSCSNTWLAYGTSFACTAAASSTYGAAQGSIGFQLDGGASVSVPLSGGSGSFSIPEPAVGSHTLVITYLAPANYAANSAIESFGIYAAPVTVSLVPSAWTVNGGNLTLKASVGSATAGPPAGMGSVAFSSGSKPLGTIAVDGSGNASITVPVSQFTLGTHTFSAAYSGSASYGAGGTTIVVTVAAP